MCCFKPQFMLRYSNDEEAKYNTRSCLARWVEEQQSPQPAQVEHEIQGTSVPTKKKGLVTYLLLLVHPMENIWPSGKYSECAYLLLGIQSTWSCSSPGKEFFLISVYLLKIPLVFVLLLVHLKGSLVPVEIPSQLNITDKVD